jgi:hypothetical protein
MLFGTMAPSSVSVSVSNSPVLKSPEGSPFLKNKAG